MFKLIPFLLLLIIAFGAKGQEAFFKYKEAADKVIRREFDTSILTLLKCSELSVEMLDGTSSWYPSYEKFKFEKAKFLTITFTYSFFSTSINNYFDFYVTVNSKKVIANSKAISDSIPICIRRSLSCDFIKKETALEIAFADSLQTSSNLTVTFERAPNQLDFYWVIRSEPKQVIESTKSTKSPVSKYEGGPKYLKYINATTGEIISREYFFKHL